MPVIPPTLRLDYFFASLDLFGGHCDGKTCITRTETNFGRGIGRCGVSQRVLARYGIEATSCALLVDVDPNVYFKLFRSRNVTDVAPSDSAKITRSQSSSRAVRVGWSRLNQHGYNS